MPTLRTFANTGRTLTAKELSIPPLPESSVLSLPPNAKASGWMPGVRTDLENVDYYLVRSDKYDLEGYQRAGGHPDMAIAHWLMETEKVEPLWDDNAFRRHVTRLKDMGINKVIAPDISTWLELPIAVQFYNIYRSAVINVSLGELGFRIVPNMKCHSLPNHLDVYMGSWPKESASYRGPILVDAHTLRGEELNDRIWRFGATEYVAKHWPNSLIWVWSHTKRYAKWWAQNIGQCDWVPARSYMQGVVESARKRTRRKNER